MPHYIPENKSDTIKISIIGAAGGIGQSLSLLLKTQLEIYQQNQNNKKFHLALYDVNKEAVDGVTVDLSHIDTNVSVSNHSPGSNSDIKDCLTNTNIIVIPAGMPRKPGMTRDDLFNINAKIVTGITDDIAKYTDLSKVIVLVISNPVNSLVPVMVERLKQTSSSLQSGIEKRIFGITNLDIVRASTFLNEIIPSSNLPFIPVIGGHSGETIMPIFSQSPHFKSLSQDQIDFLINRVQYGGDEVVKAKNGKGSATLSMAHAAFKTVIKFVSVLTGNKLEVNIINFTSLIDFNNNPIAPGADKLLSSIQDCQYFAAPMTINRFGIKSVDSSILSNLNNQERTEMLPTCVLQLKKNINNGQQYIQSLSTSQT